MTAPAGDLFLAIRMTPAVSDFGRACARQQRSCPAIPSWPCGRRRIEVSRPGGRGDLG
jgi:hypothetical protein